jgi:hypothetical protein
MATTFALAGPGLGPARVQALVRLGLAAGLGLLVLPVLVVATAGLSEPGNRAVIYILGAETVLIASAQVAISYLAIRSSPTPGLVGALIPAVIAGIVVTPGDVAAASLAFGTPANAEVVSTVVAYDIVFGVMIAVPFLVVARATSLCRRATRKGDVDASADALIGVYRCVLAESTCKASRMRSRVLHIRTLLTHQLLLRHIRRTLEAAQRGYAQRTVAMGLDKAEARDRKTIDDYLQSVPPISGVVPIPTVATIFLLWKVVPVLVALAAAFAVWIGGDWGTGGAYEPVTRVVPEQIASFLVDGLALGIAFSLLMLVLTPAIRRRDELLAEYKVCEREVVLMDDQLQVARSSRRFEYVMAALPALPLMLCGGVVLAYALAGLFVYPSPQGPLGGLVERADVMHLGPVTGVALAQPFLVAAALWIAWIVRTRKTTRVVFL